MARIDSAYDYFLTTYGENMGGRYDSHKKSELRDTYNSILKSNKKSPLYKITQTGDVTKFAIDIKEHANSLSRSINELGKDQNISTLLDRRVATSSNESAVEAKYVGEQYGEAAPEFEITIDKLATPQVNTGRYLNALDLAFEEGQYSFDVNTIAGAFEFQCSVASTDTNYIIQQKIMRLFNTSDIGLGAQMVTNERNQTALSVYSKATGLGENETSLFAISSNTSYRELSMLGIGEVTEPATNSNFKLNGTEHSSMSNSFTINKSFELTIKSVTEGAVRVGYKNDTDAIADGVNRLLQSYNGMVDVGIEYSNIHGNTKLYKDVTSIGRGMGTSLAGIGISEDADGHLILDKEVLSRAIDSDKQSETFGVLDKFKGAVATKARNISINPMNYVNKIVVEYKNPDNEFAYPYAPSAYAGMLVDAQL